jgi:CDP-paratose 2-epimerase
MRSYFFGEAAFTGGTRRGLEKSLPRYRHQALDIRGREAVEKLFRNYGKDVSLVVYTAAQPNHDWAAKEPHTDFSVNAIGTLNLLEAARQSCPEAPFIFTSTNKVYGDIPNRLPLTEMSGH